MGQGPGQVLATPRPSHPSICALGWERLNRIRSVRPWHQLAQLHDPGWGVCPGADLISWKGSCGRIVHCGRLPPPFARQTIDADQQCLAIPLHYSAARGPWRSPFRRRDIAAGEFRRAAAKSPAGYLPRRDQTPWPLAARMGFGNTLRSKRVGLFQTRYV